eukprot:Pgem_evm1s840
MNILDLKLSKRSIFLLAFAFILFLLFPYIFFSDAAVEPQPKPISDAAVEPQPKPQPKPGYVAVPASSSIFSDHGKKVTVFDISGKHKFTFDKMDPKKNQLQKMMFIFWFGEETWSSARDEAFHSLSNLEMPIIFIKSDIVQNFEMKPPAFRIHKDLDKLSGIHQGDYLRCYFMRFFGGGYGDIKYNSVSWKNEYNKFQADDDAWLLGVKEPTLGGVACHDINLVNASKICNDMSPERITEEQNFENKCCSYVKQNKDLMSKLVTNCYYIMRPNTPLAIEWLTLANEALAVKMDRVIKYPPSTGRCCLQIVTSMESYPIRWAELHGEIFHPMQMKYIKH